MRALAVSHSREVMGTEHSLFNLAPALGERGITVALAARPGGELEKKWRDLGLEFIPTDLPERRGVRTSNGSRLNSLTDLIRLPFLTAIALVRVARVARRAKADVIHSNSIITHIDCALAGLLTRKRTVVELHDIVAPGIGRLLLGIAVMLASTAVATSEAVRDQLPRWARRKSVLIPQGIDLSRFEMTGPPTCWRTKLTENPEGTLIAAVGRFDPEKGLHTLVETVAELRQRGVDAHLALVGAPSKDDGGYLAALHTLAENLLPGTFHVVPQVDDVAGVLRAIDVLACLSEEEPFGLIILEAQACGVPVVVSGAGGPLDFVTDRVTGMLVRPADPVAAADAIEELLGDAELRDRLVSAARHRVEGEYTAEVRADQFTALYRNLLRKRSG